MNVVASGMSPQLIASVLSWWQEAGVDYIAADDAEPWLGRQKLAPAAKISPPSEASAEAPLPATLATFVEWMMQGENLPLAGPANQRVGPNGAAGSALMILTDMPEIGDAASGTLLSGDVGALFDTMLKAMGQEREGIYCASLLPGRTPSGQIEDSHHKTLARTALHHIRLAAPKYVWMLGQTTSRVMLGLDAAALPGKLHYINHEGGMVGGVGSFHPRLLLQNPKRKARVWADMQILMGELRS
jgi:uracil-DNA glycosylase